MYRYITVDSTKFEKRLLIYATGKKIAETDLNKDNSEGILAVDNLQGSMLHGIVTDNNHKIVAGRSLAINTVLSEPFTFQALGTVKAHELFDITLKGDGQNVCLMMRLEKVESPLKHLIKQGIDSFQDLDATLYRQLLTGQYPYFFLPEQVLSIKGKVKTEHLSKRWDSHSIR